MGKVTVVFEKTFTSGALKGQSFIDSTPFIDIEHANIWIDGMKDAQEALNCIFTVVGIE